MLFEEYQKKSRVTVKYPNPGNNTGYVVLGLASEAGEVCDKFKKLERDHGNVMTEEYKKKISLEIGDCLYYLAQLCTELNLNFGDVARENLEKLFSRMERGVISGSGDDR